MAPPKAILFDMGGVCVLSPMQAITDYENKHGIPTNWINYAISHSAPNGYWQRLERGEIKMDADFFKGFSADLHNAEAWKDYNITFRSGKKKLKNIANPTQLGDHVSLKAEATDSEPTDQDRGAQSSPASSSTGKDTSSENGNNQKAPKKLKDLAKENPSMLGDPVSLKAETADSAPTKDDRGAQSNADQSSSGGTGNSTHTKPSTSLASTIPPLPTIEAESLFWSMMKVSQEPDPYVYPALQALASSQKFILGALTNTVIFHPAHPYSLPSPLRTMLNSLFSVFVASAEVGLRKPDPKIYELALQKLDEFDRQKGGSGVKAGDVVFLDDIGQNLKPAQELGMQTVRVRLGKTWRAVKELEGLTGVELMDEKTRRAKL
ncbi:MAG: hypothetical protein Q9187_002394 [Circinaria calcarea]